MVTFCLLGSIKLGALTSGILLSLLCVRARVRAGYVAVRGREHSPEGIPAQEQRVRSDQVIAGRWQAVRLLHICRKTTSDLGLGSASTFELPRCEGVRATLASPGLGQLDF